MATSPASPTPLCRYHNLGVGLRRRKRMQAERARQRPSAPIAIYCGNQGGKSQTLPRRLAFQNCPELGLQRNAGAVPGDADGTFFQQASSFGHVGHG